jgi:hypothetical protein
MKVNPFIYTKQIITCLLNYVLIEIIFSKNKSIYITCNLLKFNNNNNNIIIIFVLI